jgi:hypothetical protein
MKTTIEIPDDLLRRSKATAALAGQSLKDFVTAAIEDHLDRQPSSIPRMRGWRSVFGHAAMDEVAEIDAIVASEFERVDPEEWR